MVVDFINRDGALDEFYDRADPLLDYLLPQYLAEGKSHLVVAIGCTGGRHRSVAIAEHLGAPLRATSDDLSSTSSTATSEAGGPELIDHVGFEVADLARVGARSTTPSSPRSGRGGCSTSEHARRLRASIDAAVLVHRRAGSGPAPGYGHLALRGQRQGRRRRRRTRPGSPTAGRDDGAAGPAAAVRRALLRGLPARPRRAAGRGRLAREAADR